MTLTEAKRLADKLSAGRSTVYTHADKQEAKKLLERTNRGSKTQKAWDRLKRRLEALAA
jgi:hypothetical protein